MESLHKKPALPVDLATPITVGPLTLPNRVFLAPMSGVTDVPFRRLALKYGAGLVVSEMVASRELCAGDSESRKRALPAHDDGSHCRAVQLAGTEAHWMGEAARIAQGEGADLIDINMGCPAKKVTGKQSGSALMRDPDHALSLIEAVVGAVDVPVTLKMRLGWDHDSINAPMLAARAQDAGVQMITVHGRTRCQLYTGVADWTAVGAVSAVPLVVNGDICDAGTATQALAESGAHAVMVGRATYGQPWLCGQMAGHAQAWPAVTDIADHIRAHHEAMLEHYGIDTGMRHARKHIGWYADRFIADPVARSQAKAVLMQATQVRAVHAAIDDWFSANRSQARAA